MNSIVQSLKNTITNVSAKSLVLVAKKSVRTRCLGPWYEPKIPNELKKQK